MNKAAHRRKLIAPIVVASIVIVYYAVFAAVCLFVPGIPVAIRLIFGIFPLVLAGVCIGVLIQRIKEIRSGEEDDLSQY